MTFYEVLDALLNSNAKIKRENWDESSFLYLVQGSTFTVSRPPLNELIQEGSTVNYDSHIDMFEEVDGEYYASVYTPTQDDILTDDWEIVGYLDTLETCADAE